jgi:large subunit ribosomal protein L15
MNEDDLAVHPVGLHTLRPAPGARKPRKRVGRGHGSGHVKTAGRGTKGQKARTGGSIPPRFEGGQLPLVKRLPYKRGFVNIFRTEYAPVNLARLNTLPEVDPITPETLVAARIIKNTRTRVKILGEGEWTRPVRIVAHAFSASARAKIEAAGGQAEVIDATATAEPSGKES